MATLGPSCVDPTPGEFGPTRATDSPHAATRATTWQATGGDAATLPRASRLHPAANVAPGGKTADGACPRTWTYWIRGRDRSDVGTAEELEVSDSEAIR